MPDALLAAVELAGLAVDSFGMPEVLLVAELAIEGQLLIVGDGSIDHFVSARTDKERRLLLDFLLWLTHQQL